MKACPICKRRLLLKRKNAATCGDTACQVKRNVRLRAEQAPEYYSNYYIKNKRKLQKQKRDYYHRHKDRILKEKREKYRLSVKAKK